MHVSISGMLSGSHKKIQVTGDVFEVSSGLVAVWFVYIQPEVYESTQLVGFSVEAILLNDPTSPRCNQ
jgi:hypothetical protein